MWILWPGHTDRFLFFALLLPRGFEGVVRDAGCLRIVLQDVSVQQLRDQRMPTVIESTVSEFNCGGCFPMQVKQQSIARIS